MKLHHLTPLLALPAIIAAASTTPFPEDILAHAADIERIPHLNALLRDWHTYLGHYIDVCHSRAPPYPPTTHHRYSTLTLSPASRTLCHHITSTNDPITGIIPHPHYWRLHKWCDVLSRTAPSTLRHPLDGAARAVLTSPTGHLISAPVSPDTLDACLEDFRLKRLSICPSPLDVLSTYAAYSQHYCDTVPDSVARRASRKFHKLVSSSLPDHTPMTHPHQGRQRRLSLP